MKNPLCILLLVIGCLSNVFAQSKFSQIGFYPSFTNNVDSELPFDIRLQNKTPGTLVNATEKPLQANYWNAGFTTKMFQFFGEHLYLATVLGFSGSQYASTLYTTNYFTNGEIQYVTETEDINSMILDAQYGIGARFKPSKPSRWTFGSELLFGIQSQLVDYTFVTEKTNTIYPSSTSLAAEFGMEIGCFGNLVLNYRVSKNFGAGINLNRVFAFYYKTEEQFIDQPAQNKVVLELGKLHTPQLGLIWYVNGEKND